MRCLITGVEGFAGYHLANHLLSRGDEVMGFFYPLTPPPPGYLPAVATRPVDINDTVRTREALWEAAPDVVFHLAAVANVKVSWENKRQALETNILGAFSVLEAAATMPVRRPRVLLVGSSEQYGPVPPERQPIRESCELDPRNPYGVSKAAQEHLGRCYFHTDGLPVHLVRSFNHIGPRQAPTFVASSFAHQIAEIEAGRRENVIYVGNLESRRDFTDVRDTMRAYTAVVERGEPGEAYNVCSGKPVQIADILNWLIALASCEVRVKVDPARYRPVDLPVLCGDATKIRRQCGWGPEIDIQQTLADLLDYWRAELRSGGQPGSP